YNITLADGLEGANRGDILGGAVMRNRMARAIVLGLTLALLLSGCGGSSSSTVLPKNSPTADSAPSTTPTAIKTPGPLPNDIPVYTGAQLVLAQFITTGALYFYRVIDSTPAVYNYYLDQMPKHGWKQVTSQKNGSEGMYLVYTKDSRTITMNIVPD